MCILAENEALTNFTSFQKTNNFFQRRLKSLTYIDEKVRKQLERKDTIRWFHKISDVKPETWLLSKSRWLELGHPQN